MGPEIIWGLGLGYVALSTIMGNLPGKFKVKRIAKSGILNKKIVPSEVQHLSIDQCLRFDENNEIIKTFVETLEKSFSDCDLSTFYSNISDLKIDLRDESFLLNLWDLISGSVVGGSYSNSSNKINVRENQLGRNFKKKEVLFHELLHMASSRKIEKTYFSGFRIVGEKESIGEGLNEGYTELLNCRYFSGGREVDSYYNLQIMALGIESIFGQKKMKQAYFVNDLQGLVEELKKYTSYEDIITLLVKMDSLLERKYNIDFKKEANFAKEIRTDIANIKLKKLKMQKENGEISEREYINSVYAQELYINGYVSYRKKDSEGNVVKNIISSSPSISYGFIELSTDEFERYANDYYFSRGDSEFRYDETWKNKHGSSTIQMIEVLMITKKETDKKKVSDKLGIVKKGDFELDDMFVVKEGSSDFKISNPGKKI